MSFARKIMNTQAQTYTKLALAVLIPCLLLVPAQSEELSSEDLKKAQNNLQGFEFSVAGVKPPEAFQYTEGHFPRATLVTELNALEEFFKENKINCLPIHLTTAFKRDELSDAELVIAVRTGRVISERVSKRLKTISESGPRE